MCINSSLLSFQVKRTVSPSLETISFRRKSDVAKKAVAVTLELNLKVPSASPLVKFKSPPATCIPQLLTPDWSKYIFCCPTDNCPPTVTLEANVAEFPWIFLLLIIFPSVVTSHPAFAPLPLLASPRLQTCS